MPGFQEVKTVILRFRDLATGPGATIERHKAILDERDHVWWGWWSKGGEKVPLEVFADLKSQASSGDGLQLLLFDSGREDLYAVRCADIRWDDARNRMASPETDATPEYYRDEDYLAWFKFVEMAGEPVEDPEELLQQLAYVRIDDFFETAASRYKPFYGKKVATPQELRQQDRTIWFLRDAEPGDPGYEIELLNARSLAPSHFPEKYFQTESTRLLWVSDLHFGNHSFPLEGSASANTLAQRIQLALGSQSLAGAMVSGDLTWRADPSEFEQAGNFLSAVQSFARLDPYQIAVCPGNHDIRFSSDPADKGKEVEHSDESSRIAYDEFYNSLFYQPPNSYLSCGRRFLFKGTVPLEVVCLNSSLLQQSEGMFQGHGFVGDDQLNDAADKMGWSPDAETHPTRILMIHHHVLPVTFREVPRAGALYSVVFDVEAVVRWIVRHRIKVVLHGHMHNPFYSKVTRPVSFGEAGSKEHTFTVLGIGSTGVDQAELGEISDNMFALLDFSQRSLRVSYHKVHRTNPTGEIQSITVSLEGESDR